MSATHTARAVLQWAAMPEGAPPTGDLEDLPQLLEADASLHHLLGQTAAIAMARLGLSNMAQESLGVESLCLAAAIGAAQTQTAMDLLRLCPTPRLGPTLALHHTLVQPTIGKLPASFVEELLLRSPLTALLFLPPKGGEDAAITLCEQLTTSSNGKRLLVQHFADPNVLAGQLSWRAHIMAAIRTDPGQPAFVLDVYEAAVALHANSWKVRIQEAMHILAEPKPGEQALQLAMASGRWWEAFLSLFRADHEAIRERRYLNDFELYLAGVRLAQTTIRLREGHH